MITILHGDDIESSRNELQRLRKSAVEKKDIISIDGKRAKDADIVQAVESQSLFGGDKLVIVEHAFGHFGRKTSEIKKRAELLKGGEDVDILIWEGKSLGKTAINALGKEAVVREFKLPVTLFAFLDGLAPGSVKSSLTLYEQTVATAAPELIYSLVVRRVRELIQVRGGVMPEKTSSWQMSKLRPQSQKFSEQKLLDMHRRLLDMDISIKTGNSPLPLSQLLEQFIISL